MGDVSDTIAGIDSALGNSSSGAPPIAFIQPPAAPSKTPAAQSGSPVDGTISAIDAALNAAPAPAGAPAPPAAAAQPSDRAPPSEIQTRPPIAFSDVPMDMAKSLGAGIETGVAAIPGIVGDISRFADYAPAYLMAKGADWLGMLPKGKTSADLVSDASKGDVQDPLAPPTSAQTVGLFERAFGSTYNPQSVPGDYAKTIGTFLPTAGRNVLSAALLPAIGSETLGQVTKGTGLEPYARAAGAFGGTAAGMAAVGGAEAAGVAKRALDDYRLPASPEGQQQIAAQRLYDAASDPAAVQASLAATPPQSLAREIINPAQPNYEILPGSRPTTFQVTGDLGLGQLERQARNNPGSAVQFIDRDADQNAARVGTIQNLQPSGSPADVAAQFRQMRDALDQQTQAQVAAVTPAAQDANAAMGGHGTAESTGYAARQPMADARATAKEQEDRLWSLVNQNGGVPTSGVAQAAQDVGNGMSRSATPMSGEEARIFDIAGRYPDVLRFGELKDLRSAITDETANARAAGNTQTARRLGILRQAVDAALDHGVETQAAMEHIAVQRGLMAPENTIGASLQRQADEYRIEQAQTRRATGSSDGNAGALDAARVPSADRGSIQGGGQFGIPPRDQGLQGPHPGFFTPEDVANYRAATAATRNRAQTFDEGTAGKVLQPAARGGYAMPDAAVPAAIIQDGKSTGALSVRQFLAAGGTPDALADATAYTIRKAAMLGDGTLDPGKVHAWLHRNADAIAEMPPEVAARFRTAADAQQAVNDMVSARKEALEGFDKTSLARIAGLQDSEDVVRHVASVLGRPDAVSQMRTLAQAAANDPAARDGLRRALAEHMTQKLLSNAEAGTSGVQQLKGDSFSNYLRANAGALRQVFSPAEMDNLAAVGRDVQRSNRVVVATKGNKGSPGTAQDLLAAPGDASILTKALLEAGPAVAGKVAGGWTGAALGWLGAKVIARGRAAGLEQVDKLVTEALLNPPLAKSLLAKVPPRPETGTAQSLGSKFAGIAAKAAYGAYSAGGR